MVELPGLRLNLPFENGLGWLLVGGWLVYVVWYWVVLWSILRRPDWKTDQRILWFLVITMAPVLGLLSHFCLVPPPRIEDDGGSES